MAERVQTIRLLLRVLGTMAAVCLALGGCDPIEILLNDPSVVDDDDTSDDDSGDDDTSDDDTSDDDTSDDDSSDDDSAGDDDTSDDDTSDDDTSPVDGDGDGWDETEDCDDNDPLVNPGATEFCDGADNDCDLQVDEDCLDCDGTVPGDWATIQAGIDGAGWGEVVCVEPGTYVELLDFNGAVVTVVGIAGPTVTIVDGDNAGSVLTMNSGETSSAILQGFTLTGGMSIYGGGVYIESSAPTLRNLVVIGNEAVLRGGGIYLFYGWPAFEGVQVIGNTAGDVGGGLDEHTSGGSFQRVTFAGNDALAGGGVYLTTSSSQYNDVVFHENASLTDGGGMAVTGGGTPALYNAVFAGNTANGDGGGLLATASSPGFDNVIVAGNTALGDGGGLYFEGSSNPSLVNVSVVGNEAGGFGGGLGIASSYGYYTAVTFSGNTAGTSGGGVYASGGLQTLSHCNSWGNAPDDYDGMTDPTGTSGNISDDPGHLDTTAADPLLWDVHLGVGSPLIDACDGVVTDPDGLGGDIGAYGGDFADSWDLDGDGYPQWWPPGPYDYGTYPGLSLDCDDLDPVVFPGQGC